MNKQKARSNIKYIIPDAVTASRLIGAVCLIFTDLFSPAYFAVYLLCGVSDVLDGYLARKLNACGRCGAVLDSISDLAFYFVSVYMIFPYIYSDIDTATWICGAAAAVLRLAVYAAAAVKYRSFASTHTYLNKLTGLLFFSIPFAVYFAHSLAVCFGACAVAITANIEELFMLCSADEYVSDRKSIFLRKVSVNGENDSLPDVNEE